MKQNEQKHGRRSFWQGRGFYMILAVCLIAIGGFGILTLVETISLGQEEPPPRGTTVAPAGQTVPTIPDLRTTVPTQPSTTAPTRPSVKPSNTEPADLFILPLTNEVLASYSEAPVYSETMESWRVHTGVDFRGEGGQEVKALADGTVQEVYYDALWGDCITLDHGNGVQSLYCGVKTSCQVGEEVKVGAVIGLLGDIPCECRMPTHLHLEIRQGGETLDPVAAIGREVRTEEME